MNAEQWATVANSVAIIVHVWWTIRLSRQQRRPHRWQDTDRMPARRSEWDPGWGVVPPGCPNCPGPGVPHQHGAGPGPGPAADG